MTTNSFEKHHRLLKACDFSYLKTKSKMVSAPWIRAYFANSRVNSQDTRIGFSVVKKVGKAHLRNRLRRILRDDFRLSKFRNLGLDVLIVVSPNLYSKTQNRSTAESYLRQSFVKVLSSLEDYANRK